MIDDNLLKKLPKYAQKWDWEYLQKVDNHCVDAAHKALDTDPKKIEEPEVSYVCDNFEEFAWYVRKYHEKFQRMN